MLNSALGSAFGLPIVIVAILVYVVVFGGLLWKRKQPGTSGTIALILATALLVACVVPQP